MQPVRLSVLGAVAALAASPAAIADTVATFADPSPGGFAPLFSLTGNTLSGGWSGTGLTLETPGLPSVGDFADATFQMTPLTVSQILGVFYVTSPGTIRFFDSSASLLLQIDFTQGVLSLPLSFGGSDMFIGQDVVFSGPILDGYEVTLEQFSFSFANPVNTQQGFTATSSFTSSAELRIPGPATLAALGMGLLVTGRRRRS
ncbi:MAG: hypothetical protein ACK4WH_01120 [Phycisphaerales bacterium]